MVKGVIIALLHYMLTELRAWIILWYVVYHTTKITTIDIAAHITNKQCKYDAKPNRVEKIRQCVSDVFLEYLRAGSAGDCQKHCSADGDTYLTLDETAGSRIIIFVATVWLLGSFLTLLCVFLRKRPNYFKMEYIVYTQTLYAGMIYKIVVYATVVACLAFIIAAMYLVGLHGFSWKKHIFSLILVVLGCRHLLQSLHGAFDMNSEEFPDIKINRGKTVFAIVMTFALTSNASVLQAIEVQVIRHTLRKDITSVAGSGFNPDLEPMDENDIVKLVQGNVSGSVTQDQSV